MNREMTYLKQLFLKNIQVFILAFIVFFVSFSSRLMFQSFGMILVVAVSMTTVLVLMDYQYRRHSMDFYYSLPITRKKLFWIHALVALANIIIPYMVVLMLMPIYSRSEFKTFIFELILMFPLLVSSMFAFIAITAFSNSRIDSILLCLLYPIVLFVAFVAIQNFVESNYIFGLDIGKKQIVTYLSSALLLAYREMIEKPQLLFVLGVSFLIQVLFWIIISNYFVDKRKIEYAGIGNLELRRYQYVRVIATMVMFFGITASTYSIANLYTFSILNFKDALKLVAKIVSNGFVYILVGFVFYLIISFIVQRKVDKVLNHVIQYILLFASFLTLFTGVTLFKKWFFEDKIPSQVNRVQFRYEKKQFELDFLPRITYNNIEQEFHFESEEIKNVALQLHKQSLNYRKSGNNIQTRMEIIYNPDTVIQLKRAYFLDKSATVSLTRKLLEPTGEFATHIFNLIERNDSIKLYYQFEKRELATDQKEILNQFMMYYFQHFNPEMYHGAEKEVLGVELGNYKLNFTIYLSDTEMQKSDIEMQKEVDKLFSLLK